MQRPGQPGLHIPPELIRGPTCAASLYSSAGTRAFRKGRQGKRRKNTQKEKAMIYFIWKWPQLLVKT